MTETARSRVAFAAVLLVLCAQFLGTLREVVALALGHDLYSHILLVPAISVYLVWSRRGVPGPRCDGPSRRALPAAALLGAAAALLLRHHVVAMEAPAVDRLALGMFAFITLVVAAVRICWGREFASRHAFALLFLYFCVPLPRLLEFWISTFLQHGSALVSHSLIQLTGTPVLRQGMLLHLPNVVLEVAEECSGIRSSLVLFMAALLAGHLFLSSAWARVLLAVVVIPLSVLRNAVRITALAWMAVHVDAGVLAGPLHREGGVPFFVLSLIPLLLVLVMLRMAENRSRRHPPQGKVPA